MARELKDTAYRALYSETLYRQLLMQLILLDYIRSLHSLLPVQGVLRYHQNPGLSPLQGNLVWSKVSRLITVL